MNSVDSSWNLSTNGSGIDNALSNNDSISDLDPELPRGAELLLLTRNCLAFPLCLVILLSNSLVVVCVFKSPPVQSFTCLLLVSLCTSDLFTGGILLPMVFGGQMSSDAPDELCTTIAHVEPVLGVVSVTQILAINFDRFLCLQFPLHYHSFMGVWLLLLLVVPPWVLAAIQLAITNLTGEINTTPTCLFYPPGQIPMLVATFFFVVPFIAICVIYGFIWRIVQHHFEFKAEMARDAKCCGIEGCACLKNKPSKIFHLKITRTVAVVVGTLVLSWGPYITATLAYNYVSNSTKETLVFYVIPLAELLVFMKSAINPWIFAFSYPKFKTALFVLIKSPCGSWQKRKTPETKKLTGKTTRNTAVVSTTASI